ncbi:MAG TPA: GAF domain-containing sensor histidine kinase [Candidatus Saccharimonadales bacterium]|nr:GAF domain-containing sensor histidine kinase [Candidatus Saccharimonadales bacterium]
MDDSSKLPQSKDLFLRPKKIQSVLDDITQEMYRRNYELAQNIKTLSLLKKIDELALESHESMDIFCGTLASAIVSTAEYPFVEIIIKSYGDKPIQSHGLFTDKPIGNEIRTILTQIQIDESTEWYKNNLRTKLISSRDIFDPSGGLVSTYKFSSEQIERLLQTLPIQSLLLVKLSARDKQVGLMLVGFLQKPDQLIIGDVQLISQLSKAAGVAVDNKLLFEENKIIVGELQQSNVKLTEIDKIKDDFISVASHQLRTPLTAINGYVGMVIDGLAGQLNDKQKTFLTQALTSSKLMSVMVSDLLDITRIQSGKFFMNYEAINLADLTETTVNEVAKIAESAKITLSFKKPDNFPVTQLDENKTANVILNFIDNAIHYSKPSGHVSIDLTHDNNNVVLRVKDDGMGVPESAKKDLFTKFFRAENAKQARPDGTGIGLYLAKKVVDGQKGTLIFESKENEGSVFGFSFPIRSTPPSETLIPEAA